MTAHRERLAAEPWRRIYGTEKWARTRAIIRRRAGGRCKRCGRETTRLDVNHITALGDGGAPYDPANLEALCRPCHRASESSGARFFRASAPHLASVEKSPPDPEKSPEPGEKWGWTSPSGKTRCSRQWLPDYYWAGPGEPPPGKLD